MTAATCPRCDLGDYTRTKREDGVRHVRTVEIPPMEDLEAELSDACCTATDGCYPVEPDGRCEHSHPSFFLAMGLI